VLAVIALGLAALPWPLLMRLAPLICIAPLATSIDEPLAAGAAQITVLDVGEGAAVVVRTARHVLVYGTGDSYGTNGRVAENVVAPFLRSTGVHSIDRLVIPRASPASGAGVTALWAQMPIGRTLVGEKADAVDPASIDCASEPSPWRWDGVTFVLGNASAGHACALAIRTAAGEVRIPGDIDAVIIQGDKPRWVVVPGRRARRSLAKYVRIHPELQGVEVLATADRGAIRVPLDGARGPGTPEAYRAHRRTLWSGSP
jgi:competence protein ComEC